MTTESAGRVRFPDAHYLVLSSRLIPGLDGGYTVATLARARQMAACGIGSGAGPLLLTFDPGAAADHAVHRAEFARRGMVTAPDCLRNLFDEAGGDGGSVGAGDSDGSRAAGMVGGSGADSSDAADSGSDAGMPGADGAGRTDGAGLGAAEDNVAAGGDRGGAASWLRAAAEPGERDPALEYRTLRDREGRAFLALPQVPDPAGWHLSEAPVAVFGADGTEVGVARGFRGLYRAWLEHVVAGLRRVDPALPVVAICESRQLGELLTDWDDPGVRIVHTIHTMHVEPPYTPDAPLNPLWRRWFACAERFDAVAWPTAAQCADVVARFGGDNHLVVPNGVAVSPTGAASPTGAVSPSVDPSPNVAFPPNVSASSRGAVSPGAAAHRPAARSSEALAGAGPAAARSEDGVGTGRVAGRVVMINRLAPGKRIDHAIRAFLAAAVPGATLEIWGDGPERAALEALIDEREAADRIALRGATETPGEVLDAASLFVSSTAYEGQGLAIVEALAHGCPVVTYDVRYGPADALATGGGLLVPDGDEHGLAEAIGRVLQDDELRRRLAGEAPGSARRWSADAAMHALAATCGRVLSAPPRR